jgi:hypothetical protein
MNSAVTVWEQEQADTRYPNWKIIGKPITDSTTTNQINLSYFDYVGVVLSGNGQVLVASKTKNDASGIPTELGYTSYKWNSIVGSWDLMDDKGGLLSTIQYTAFKARAALSNDGTVLAVCFERRIDVYSWNEEKSAWIPRDSVFDFNNG